jgi:hypothetical protein
MESTDKSCSEQALIAKRILILTLTDSDGGGGIIALSKGLLYVVQRTVKEELLCI